jgi:hypothetical protein
MVGSTPHPPLAGRLESSASKVGLSLGARRFVVSAGIDQNDVRVIEKMEIL